MRNINMAVRDYYNNDRYMWAIIIRRFCDRWVPPPPNPSPITAKEKHLAIVRRFKEPPLCDCGDRAMINPENMLEFVCPNKHKVSGKCICLNIYLYVCVY
jgi:hypothetical protein